MELISYDPHKMITEYAHRAAGMSGIELDGKMRAFNAPLLIAGCPRSRTSMVSFALALTGAFWFGPTRIASRSNPTGFWENSRLFKSITQSWIPKKKGLITAKPGISEHSLENPEVVWCRSAALCNMISSGWNGQKWALKDPLISFFAPDFLKIFPSAKLLICKRNPEDTLKSMAAFYGSEREEDVRRSRDAFLEHAAKSLTYFGKNALEVDTDRLSRLDKMEVAKLSSFLKLTRIDLGSAICDALVEKSKAVNPAKKKRGAKWYK